MHYQLPGLPQLPRKLRVGNVVQPSYGAAYSHRYSRPLEGSRFRNYFAELQHQGSSTDLHATGEDDEVVEETGTSNPTAKSVNDELVPAVLRPISKDHDAVAKEASTTPSSLSSWKDWQDSLEEETGTSISTSPKGDDATEQDTSSSSSDGDDSYTGLTPEERSAKLFRDVVKLCESFLGIFDDVVAQRQQEDATAAPSSQEVGEAAAEDATWSHNIVAWEIASSYATTPAETEVSQRESDARYANYVMCLVHSNQQHATSRTARFTAGLAAIANVDNEWQWRRVVDYVEDMGNR